MTEEDKQMLLEIDREHDKRREQEAEKANEREIELSSIGYGGKKIRGKKRLIKQCNEFCNIVRWRIIEKKFNFITYANPFPDGYDSDTFHVYVNGYAYKDKFFRGRICIDFVQKRILLKIGDSGKVSNPSILSRTKENITRTDKLFFHPLIHEHNDFDLVLEDLRLVKYLLYKYLDKYN